MIDRAERYERRAQQADEAAARVTDPQIASAYLAIAARWRRMAGDQHDLDMLWALKPRMTWLAPFSRTANAEIDNNKKKNPDHTNGRAKSFTFIGTTRSLAAKPPRENPGRHPVRPRSPMARMPRCGRKSAALSAMQSTCQKYTQQAIGVAAGSVSFSSEGSAS